MDNAQWTEVIVEVSNKSLYNLSIEAGNLIDEQGTLLTQLSNVLLDPNRQVAKMREAQMGYGLAQEAVRLGLGSGYPYGFRYYGSGIGSLGILLSGVLSLAQQQTMMSIQKEPQRVRAEAQRRSLRLGTTLVSGDKIQGSLFFRHTSAPRELRLGYTANNKPGSVAIWLAKHPKPTYVEVVADEAAVQEEPNAKEILRNVKRGTRLEKLEEQENWIKVSLKGEGVGWISSDSVKEAEVEVVPVRKPTSSTRHLGTKIHSSNEDISVSLNQIIVPGDPGSWVRGARWDEFVVTIANQTQGDITIASSYLIDSRGVYIPRMLMTYSDLEPSRSELIAIQRAQERIMVRQARAGQIVNVNPRLPRRPGPLLELTDKHAVQAKINERSLPLFRLRLSEGGSVTGSVFFPPTQQPKALIIKYQTGGLSRSRRHRAGEIKSNLASTGPITPVPEETSAARQSPAPESSPSQIGLRRRKAEPRNPFVEVIANEAILREEPKTGKILRRVPRGAQVEKLGEKGKWTQVVLDGEEVGWIASGLLKKVSPEVPSTKGDLAYVFQEGDSLSDIAERFTGSAENWKKIADFNGISDPSQLGKGKVIKIPASLVPKGTTQ